jgi:PAS domain S-box-containing protein
MKNLRCVISFALVIASVGLFALASAVWDAPHVLLLFPIAAGAYLGGLRCGLVAIAIATTTTIVGPAQVSWLEAPAILVVGLVITLLMEELRRARRRERKNREAQDRATRRLSDVFQSCPVAMSLSRLDDGKVVQINDAYARRFGVTPESVVGHVPAEAGIVFPPTVRERCFARLAAGKSIEGVELDVQTPAGTRSVVVWSRALEIEGVQHAMTTFVDVTDHKRAIAEARTSEERFTQLAEAVHEVFWLTDPANTTMLYVSPAYEKIFGRSCAALYADPRDWLQALHPEDRARMDAASRDLADGPHEYTYRVVVDGKTRSIRIATFPVHDEHGRVVRIAGVAEDRTEQIQLEQQMRQTQKLESLGLLAGGVAHDFNNVLAVIGANAGLLSDCFPPGAEEHEIVGDIESAVRRATSLTRQLLAFSRKEVIEPIVLDVNAAIGDTRKMLRRMMGEDIVIETSLEPELGCVKIDPGYFVQILMNLAVNARDAMPCGGTFSIATRNLEHEVVVELVDTGTGMPPEVKARVFEPFFTTKAVGRGTGLGLSVVHGIVQQAGGRIEIDSEIGAGTTVRIVLPIVEAPPERVSDVVVTASQGVEKIVLVDDDVFVRRSTSRALRARGYTVLEAGDGRAALRLLESGTDVDLLVTDVVMPGMDGRQLVELARAHRPSLPVLYMSGYTDDAMIRHGLEHEHIPFIEKPFRNHVLAAKVRNLLDRPVARVA